jgi:ribosomal protein S14
MVKKSMIQREQTRRSFLNKNQKSYQEYLFYFGFWEGKKDACQVFGIEYRFVTSFLLFKESVYLSLLFKAYRIKIIIQSLSFSKFFLTGIRNRCSLSGRSRRYYRIFGLSRHFLRELAYKGILPGTFKSSWLKIE